MLPQENLNFTLPEINSKAFLTNQVQKYNKQKNVLISLWQRSEACYSSLTPELAVRLAILILRRLYGVPSSLKTELLTRRMAVYILGEFPRSVGRRPFLSVDPSWVQKSR